MTTDEGQELLCNIQGTIATGPSQFRKQGSLPAARRTSYQFFGDLPLNQICSDREFSLSVMPTYQASDWERSRLYDDFCGTLVAMLPGSRLHRPCPARGLDPWP